jgi:hypothetical protein
MNMPQNILKSPNEQLVVTTGISEPLPNNRQTPFNEDQRLCHFRSEPLFPRRLTGETLGPLE